MNRYFIINLTAQDMLNMIGKIVGNFQDQRANNDKTRVIVKLKQGDETNYLELANYSEYTYEQILEELQNPEWN